MARKKGAAHSGGHGWFVTFADLMGLLLAFFVMLVAYSSPNSKKQQIVAGSMREAFGTQRHTRVYGMIETDGLPTRSALKNVEKVTKDLAADQTTPQNNLQKDTSARGTFLSDRGFTSAAASLRQALQEMPELTEVSRNLLLEETKDGLEIQIVDQDGRSMFADGSAAPYERTRKLLMAIAPTLRRMPNRVRISGHTSANRGAAREAGIGWKLSSERALVVRDILASSGMRDDRFEAIIGRADTEPLFPDNPLMAPNRRVTILMMNEAPPLPR